MPEDWKGKVMIDSNSNGQEQDRMNSEGRVVTPFLPHREWSEDEVAELAHKFLAIKASNVRYFGIEDDCTFQFGHVELLDHSGMYLYTESKSYLHVHGNCVTNDLHKTGGVLANYKCGRMPAVDAYLASLETDENLIAEGSQSLPANSPSNDHTDSYDEAGNQNE